ncbi:MAG: hypothetical protein ACYCSF_00935 [Acidimicrobiales bacterium]
MTDLTRELRNLATDVVPLSAEARQRLRDHLERAIASEPGGSTQAVAPHGGRPSRWSAVAVALAVASILAVVLVAELARPSTRANGQ